MVKKLFHIYTYKRVPGSEVTINKERLRNFIEKVHSGRKAWKNVIDFLSGMFFWAFGWY
jgi:DNA phosphorothioation-dependent restriction protein DptG